MKSKKIKILKFTSEKNFLLKVNKDFCRNKSALLRLHVASWFPNMCFRSILPHSRVRRGLQPPEGPLRLYPSSRVEGSLIKEAASRGPEDRGPTRDTKICPGWGDLGADGCVDLDEILPSTRFQVASVDFADFLPRG